MKAWAVFAASGMGRSVMLSLHASEEAAIARRDGLEASAGGHYYVGAFEVAS